MRTFLGLLLFAVLFTIGVTFLNSDPSFGLAAITGIVVASLTIGAIEMAEVLDAPLSR